MPMPPVSIPYLQIGEIDFSAPWRQNVHEKYIYSILATEERQPEVTLHPPSPTQVHTQTQTTQLHTTK